MENNSTTKTAIKSGVWYTVSSVMVKAISLITTPIYTRLMTTEEYGIASNFISWYTLLLVFSSLNLIYSIGRAKLDYPGKLNEYVGSMQLLSAIFTLTLSVVVFIFIKPIADFMELPCMMVVLLMIYLFFAPGITFTQSKFRYSYKYKGNIFIAFYTALATAAFTIPLLLIMKTEKYYGKALGVVIPTVILSIVFWIQSIRKKQIKCHTEYWKYGLSISLPLILHSVSLNILSQSDRIMITKFCSSSDTAIYSLAYTYALLINIVLNAVNEAWQPWFHDTLFAGRTEQIRKNVKPIVNLACMLGIGCIAIAPEMILLLGSSAYSEGKWAVIPIVVGVVCQAIYQHYVHIELHEKKTQYISIGTMIAAAVNFGLNLICIPHFGFVAAAYTTLVSYLILMVVHLLITRCVLHIKLYDDWYMFAAIGVVGIMAVLFSRLYSTIIIRYAVLAIICLIYLIVNRNYIISIINKNIDKKVRKNNEKSV